MKKKLNLKAIKVNSFTTSQTALTNGGISGGACEPADKPILDTVLAAGCFPTDRRCEPSYDYYSECCPTW